MLSSIPYTVRRNIAASTHNGGSANTRIAIVLFQLPGEKVHRSLAINEDLIRAEAQGDPQREAAFIDRDLELVLLQMSAGTSLPN